MRKANRRKSAPRAAARSCPSGSCKSASPAAPSWVRICRDDKGLRSSTSPGPILGPLEIWQMLRERAGAFDQESFFVVCLDARMRARDITEVSRGTLNSTSAHPREVFRIAVATGAKSIIVAHNHPAGTLRPSNADLEVTERLRAAGDSLGIDLFDHIIVTGEGYYSLAEHGEL